LSNSARDKSSISLKTLKKNILDKKQLNNNIMKTISLLILLLISTIAFSQEYELFSIPYEFEDIDPTTGGSGTEFMQNTSDVVSDPITLGGDFNFYGQDYSQVRVATDGMLTFDLVSSFSTYQYTQLPNSGNDISNLVALYWNDLTNTGNSSYDCHMYQFIDDEKAIFQWDSVRISLYGERITAQIILDYNQNSIQFNYRTLYAENPEDWYNYGVMGIENADGTQGMQFGYNGEYIPEFILGSGYSYRIYVPMVSAPEIEPCQGVYGNPIDVTITPVPSDVGFQQIHRIILTEILPFQLAKLLQLKLEQKLYFQTNTEL